MVDKNCEKCHGTCIVKEKDGSCHTCWDCLKKGNLDVHDKNLKQTDIKL